jgi:hypothetical protein
MTSDLYLVITQRREEEATCVYVSLSFDDAERVLAQRVLREFIQGEQLFSQNNPMQREVVERWYNNSCSYWLERKDLEEVLDDEKG